MQTPTLDEGRAGGGVGQVADGGEDEEVGGEVVHLLRGVVLPDRGRAPVGDRDYHAGVLGPTCGGGGGCGNV